MTKMAENQILCHFLLVRALMMVSSGKEAEMNVSLNQTLHVAE
ncbi:hypothetical protein [Youngiibacter multivorans]|uniref:Uncharacterized protein n=1 Tax=Youngiibacter multivorans TaxID=937251 RepID=A0ABS4G5F0_9CLOT|nr:hypothetical protein [Youngiibacter multivorans]MBP1919785.1 hypothetical protein [Youngiibacter multivorans]